MNDPCPLCDIPIADTAYVCHRCARALARDLLRTAALWRSIEDAAGHGLRVNHPPSHPKPADRRPWHGPWCEGADCDHPSCRRAWWAWAHYLEEPAAAREETGMLQLEAVEAGWVAAHTFGSWAQHVADVRGIPVPHLDPPRHVEPTAAKSARRVLCEFSWLPWDACGCGRTAYHAELAEQERMYA